MHRREAKERSSSFFGPERPSVDWVTVLKKKSPAYRLLDEATVKYMLRVRRTLALQRNEEGSCINLQPLRSEPLNEGKIKLPLSTPVPIVSAQAWAVFDCSRARIIHGKDEHEQRQMASLTKIMTAYVVCTVLEELSLNPKHIFLSVSRDAQ